jgi:hypothetical protein
MVEVSPDGGAQAGVTGVGGATGRVGGGEKVLPAAVRDGGGEVWMHDPFL